MLKKHNKHGPMKWFAGVMAAAGLLLALPVAQPVYAAGDTGSSETTVQTSYVGFSAVSDVKVNNVSVKRYGHYKLMFDGNGAEAGTTIGKNELEFAENYTLPANGYTRKGYTFKDWNTKADGSGTSYKDKASVTNLANGENDAVVTLYAQWNINHYSITYDMDGHGQADPSWPTSYTIKDHFTVGYPKGSVDGKTVSGRDGEYETNGHITYFSNWHVTGAVTSDNGVVDVPAGTIGNITFKSQWNTNGFRVKCVQAEADIHGHVGTLGHDLGSYKYVKPGTVVSSSEWNTEAVHWFDHVLRNDTTITVEANKDNVVYKIMDALYGTTVDSEDVTSDTLHFEAHITYYDSVTKQAVSDTEAESLGWPSTISLDIPWGRPWYEAMGMKYPSHGGHFPEYSQFDRVVCYANRDHSIDPTQWSGSYTKNGNVYTSTVGFCQRNFLANVIFPGDTGLLGLRFGGIAYENGNGTWTLEHFDEINWTLIDPDGTETHYTLADMYYHHVKAGAVVRIDSIRMKDGWLCPPWRYAGLTHTITHKTIIDFPSVRNTCLYEFDANNGEGSMDNKYIDLSAGADRHLPKCTFTNGNRKFLGWTTDPKSRTVNYADGAELPVNTNYNYAGREHVLYAVWGSAGSAAKVNKFSQKSAKTYFNSNIDK